MHELIVKLVYDEINICRCITKSIAVQQGFGAVKMSSRPVPGYLAAAVAVTLACGSVSSYNFSLIIHADCINCMIHKLFTYIFLSTNKIVTRYIHILQVISEISLTFLKIKK